MDSFVINVDGIKYEGKGVLVDQMISTTLGSKEMPLNIHLDSDTDWSVVLPSVASIFIAASIGYVTVRVQQNQIKANIANFRQQWMSELRECASDYLRVLYSMAIRSAHQEGFRDDSVYVDFQERMAVLTIKFELLLSRDDAWTRNILELDNEITIAIANLEFGDNPQSCLQKLNAMKQLMRVELEDAWTDIKNDLRGAGLIPTMVLTWKKFWKR